MKLRKFGKGQIAVVMTLALATLLGVMALGADVGVMYYNYIQLQKGADAAALAGANYLNGGITFASANVNASCSGQADDAKKAACTYAMNNGLASDANSLTINEPGQNLPVGAPSVGNAFAIRSKNQGLQATSCRAPAPGRSRATADRFTV
jgi:Flp pilus assembly protein TadG